MLPITFKPGSEIALFGANFVVAELLDESDLLLRASDGSESRRIKLTTLLNHYCHGHLRPGNSPHVTGHVKSLKFLGGALSQSSLESGGRWLALMNAMKKEGIKPNEINNKTNEQYLKLCVEVGFTSAPHRSTVYRKYLSFICSRCDPTSLAPKTFLRGGRGKSRMPAELEEMMNSVIQNLYLTIERRSVVEVHKQLIADIRRENQYRDSSNRLKYPALTTLERHIKRLRGYEVFAARWGKRAADVRYRHVDAYRQDEAFGVIYEVDHSPMDLFVIDANSKMVCGRPRLTVMIERKSRSIVGFDIGFDGNSAAAVLRCLKHAILPKQNIKDCFESIKNEWPCFGKPSILRCDNGKEFHSESLQAACLELGIELEYCAARKPWTKGVVERFFRSVSKDFSSYLPGATSSHFYQRPEGENPEKWAVIDLNKLSELFHIWAIDVYMQSVNKNLKATPLEAWNLHFRLADIALPASVKDLDIACRLSIERRLQHYGVDIFGCTSFNHPSLTEIRKKYQFQKTISVQVRYDPASLEYIFIQVPGTTEWIEIPNSDPETAKLSVFQVKAINSYMHERRRQGFALSIVDAKRKIAEDVDRLQSTKNQHKQRQALKLLGFTSPVGSKLRQAPESIASMEIPAVATDRPYTQPILTEQNRRSRSRQANPIPTNVEVDFPKFESSIRKKCNWAGEP